MAKLSVIIPSRDERFLQPTIEDIFRNARGEIEVIAVLDSDKWPTDWDKLTAKYPNLHTIHNGASIGMRGSINKGVASAISRKAKFIMKSDGHCSFSDGFDEALKATCEPNWVVIPRRGRLDPENWCATDTHKPDIDYHYLSFPDDPADFGGPGLNGKVWEARAKERADILIDEEMSSQGSCWFMHAKYFGQLELMDEEHYGAFWNEMQEIGLKAWLSGGQLMVNKNAKYLHLHKGKKYGRGYRLEESALQQGRTYTMKWLHNEAWAKQTLPFKYIIERFWPVPGWPENWEELIYGKTDHKATSIAVAADMGSLHSDDDVQRTSSLRIHTAHYGISDTEYMNVTDTVRRLVTNGSLDIVVDNSTLTPKQNPFKGQRKRLKLTYSINGGEQVTVERQEKDWLIIGHTKLGEGPQVVFEEKVGMPAVIQAIDDHVAKTATAAALNDLLIRRFNISDRRLRGPMPVELRDFTRNDLAKLFAELGFTKGAEIGVAEGHYSEILCQSIPGLDLLCVDPWTRYSDNPRAHSDEHQLFSLNETKRKLASYPVRIIQDYSMNAVRDVPMKSLDFCYIDANHQFDYVLPDLIEWSKRVRGGGIVAGDDYYAMRHRGGVVEAVQAYVNAHQIALWFTCDAPNSYDFFWVNP